MKIVYLLGVNLSVVSGGTRIIFEHTNRLAKRGHQVEIWVSGDDSEPSYFDCAVPLRKYDPTRLGEPDVVVFTSTAFFSDTVKYRSGKATFLLMQHDNEWAFQTPLTDVDENRGLFEIGRWGIITVSSWIRQVVAERHAVDAFVVENGIEREIFSPREPLLPDPDPLVMTFYDPQEWKGFGDAYTAIRAARTRIPELRLAVVAQFMYPYDAADGMYFRFDIPVIYFNCPEQKDLVRIYSSADVFVSASWKEGFGLPGLEAMACGAPVVTTDSGGVREYAIPDETAVVVPPRDPEALAAGIERVLTDKKLAAKLKRNGLKKAAEFNWDRSIAKLEQVFLSSITGAPLTS